MKHETAYKPQYNMLRSGMGIQRTKPEKPLECQALMVSGYQKSVDAMDSSIADIAIMNDLLSQEDIEVERYTDRDSKFYQKYESLLDDLDFHAC